MNHHDKGMVMMEGEAILIFEGETDLRWILSTIWGTPEHIGSREDGKEVLHEIIGTWVGWMIPRNGA